MLARLKNSQWYSPLPVDDRHTGEEGKAGEEWHRPQSRSQRFVSSLPWLVHLVLGTFWMLSLFGALSQGKTFDQFQSTDPTAH